VTDQTTTPPYEQWTVRELRDELRARSLSTSGTQAELATRLSDSDREPADMTVAELKDELREQDKPVTGTKDELVERLTTDTDGDVPTDAAGRRECVVDDGTAHMGRATPGAKICSAHAMHYKADGTPRAEYVRAADGKAESEKAEDVNRS
jgi:hypothetical protein